MDKCETSPIMCHYMNNCTGHGKCQWNGMCQCDEGYRSADCSEKLHMLKDNYSLVSVYNGTSWAYFQFKEDMATD